MNYLVYEFIEFFAGEEIVHDAGSVGSLVPDTSPFGVGRVVERENGRVRKLRRKPVNYRRLLAHRVHHRVQFVLGSFALYWATRSIRSRPIGACGAVGRLFNVGVAPR